MSMTYYNSLSGMIAASFGLKNVSNNVSNMQSPGFKGSNVFYESLGGGGQQFEALGQNTGNGVGLGDNKINFKQGKLEMTGVNTHLAINGQGFFILQQKSGEYRYTRDGEFQFDKDGYLVDEHSGAYVMGYGHSGELTRISRDGPATNAGKATTDVAFDGKLVCKEEKKSDQDTDMGGSDKSYETMEFYTDIYDEKGQQHHLHFIFSLDPESPTQDKIILQKVEENGTEYFNAEFNMAKKSIQFDISGYAQNDSHYLDLAFNFEGCDKQTVRFDFGQSNSNYALKFVSPQSPSADPGEVKVGEQNGYAIGELYGTSFDEKGRIIYHYTNEQTSKGIHLALARFDNPNGALESSSNNAFRAKTCQGRHIGCAKDGYFGKLEAGKLELSNIDSTMEFANIVILQRMFQACSQIMEIDKQLLEELYRKA